MSGSPVLKDLDVAILSYLKQDGRTPFTFIAQELGVAEGTVRKRVARLIEEGIIEIKAVVDPFKVGMNFVAIIGVDVEGDSPDTVVAQLAAAPQVRYVVVCAGAHDIMVEAVFGSNEELYRFLTQTLRQIPGIRGSATSLVLKVCKESSSWNGWQDQDGGDGCHD
ncbi:MAG: Lrp/AsnC family transcriptional regulator [Bacillota bacterium]|nr:Lrp/AsnC family transcriptional regulator [Bacillota bacterium]HAV21891.1 Lrp/AsnC family transcriptional regulator [Bacillota bacterium]HCD41752.1 Lrp/AsnC family transcriptional regulator [Bacillota bacterium]HOB89151.1 Lrp/AsnC family transcriptional regulator [Bacillota bacterium]HOJ58059.1 Lrp/AsnC family transcriptional regulator [Bacillota bacterium]